MPTSRTRLATTALTVLVLVVCTFALVVSPPGGPPPAAATTRVDKDDCRRIDPNLVNGACLRYRTPRGSALTWIGTYRAPDGRVFFCIDFLYDSRLPIRADRVSTQALVNQLGGRVGDAEVAALNYVISRRAGHGSSGSDDRDAAIALVVREVMGDGVAPGGVEVYPGRLKVGERVAPPIGGLGGPVMRRARSMWRAASAYRGPYRIELTSVRDAPLRLGQVRRYRLAVISDAGRRVPGVRVDWDCTGPVRCPRPVVTSRRPTLLRLRPLDVGRIRVVARASGPSSDGVLYRQRGWSTHGADTALPHGVQRGWIAQENHVRAMVSTQARVRRARPQVVTRTSAASVRPGTEIHDIVTVSALPADYDATVVATLYGPYAAQPGPGDCAPDDRAGRVRFAVSGNGTFETPSLRVPRVGYYTWVQAFPGDIDTVATTTRCGLVAETTRVVPFTPVLRTTVSQQRALVGDAIHDTVVVAGAGSTPLTLSWTLHGPRPSRSGSCRGLGWSGVPVADRGSMSIAGDGTWTTPSTLLRRAGCYTYSQRVAATALSRAAQSRPGLPEETAYVDRRTPTVSTLASAQRARVGVRLHDAVRIEGLGPADRVRVHWRLHGPLAPVRGASCAGLRWSAAPVADSGSFEARADGTRRTRGTELTRPGCYTYSERVPATAATYATATEPGLPLETALVTREPTPYVPEVPTGLVAPTRAGPWGAMRLDPDGPPSQFVPSLRAEPRFLDRPYRAPATSARRSAPARGVLGLARLGIRAPVGAVGLDRGAIAVPDDPGTVGWLSTTAAPGDVVGSSLLSGHVGPLRRLGALARLEAARLGDVITWRDGGRTHRFVVRRVQRFARDEGVPARLLRTDGPHLLHLVTCTTRSGRTYLDNLVVTAEQVRGR